MIFFDEVYHSILLGGGIHAGVDDRAFAGFIVYDIRVFLVLIVFKNFDAGHAVKVQN